MADLHQILIDSSDQATDNNTIAIAHLDNLILAHENNIVKLKSLLNHGE